MRRIFSKPQYKHCTENNILFFQTSWKDGLSKKITLEYDLSCIIRKDDISFSRKYDLIPQMKNERWSFSKKYTEIWYFLQTFWKDGLSKKGRAGTWSFLYYLERWYFFPKTWYFFLNRKWETIFLKKYMEIYFLCARTGVTNMAPRPSVKKSQRWSYPAKIHLKVIDVLDWHPRKSSSNSLYFHGDLYRRFHALLSSEEKQET